MSEVIEEIHKSRIIKAGDAAEGLNSVLVRGSTSGPRGTPLRPMTRLCGCPTRKMDPEVCAMKDNHDGRETTDEYRARIRREADIEVLVISKPVGEFKSYGCAGRMWPRGQTRCKVHKDELDELKRDPLHIEVITVAEMRSRIAVPADEDPVAYFERELAKARAEAAAKAEAAKVKTQEAETTPEVAALPPGPRQPEAPVKAKK